MPDTPRRYSKLLEDIGGKNPLGEPNFILHWGEQPIRRRDCPDVLLAPYLDCWVLAYWRPPEEFGPPELWPRDLGPYPRRGAYLVFQPFRYSNQIAMLDTPALNPNVLRTAVKVIQEHLDDSLASRARVLRDQKEQQEAKVQAHIAEIIEDSHPLGEVVSYSRQQSCHSAVQQKMDQIEQYMKYAELFRLQMPRGPSVHA